MPSEWAKQADIPNLEPTSGNLPACLNTSEVMIAHYTAADRGNQQCLRSIAMECIPTVGAQSQMER